MLPKTSWLKHSESIDMLTHRFYLSGGSTGWCINDASMGTPVCDDKRTPQAALEVAKELKLAISRQMWCRDTLQWRDIVDVIFE
jgi:hypothetical protein